MNWNSNIAYAVGLITTDGNLSKDGRHMTFVSKDVSLVKLFKKCLKLKNKISNKTSGYSKGKGKYYFIQFGDVIFYRELLSIGLSPNKSKNIKNLLIPRKYFADFLRGHLDGDGNILVYNDPIYHNSRRLYLRFISASKLHIKWLQCQIKKLYGITGKIRSVPRAWILIYAKNESKILLRVIYYKQNLPFLQRKRNIIKDYL
ncbi:MAG: hypothetical protein KKH29_04845 [Candidatus Omnitrophica bacterium]|nr:hypothetical protein [Candidatus Omnitrophota bacterium]MBU4473495.1 hypothetical protein [Candidatus Omnitrophota bacterium]